MQSTGYQPRTGHSALWQIAGPVAALLPVTSGLTLVSAFRSAQGLREVDACVRIVQVVALPPVEAVTSGAVLASEVAACDEKVDIWALGVTIYELLTGACAAP